MGANVCIKLKGDCVWNGKTMTRVDLKVMEKKAFAIFY